MIYISLVFWSRDKGIRVALTLENSIGFVTTQEAGYTKIRLACADEFKDYQITGLTVGITLLGVKTHIG